MQINFEFYNINPKDSKVEIELFSVFCSHALLLALLYVFLLLVVQGEWEKELPLLGFLVQ